MKLSILKWVYDLGYKKAEDRYYHALMEQVRFAADDLKWQRPNESEKEKRQRENMLKARQGDLALMINNVFHPTEQVEVQIHDRFLP